MPRLLAALAFAALAAPALAQPAGELREQCRRDLGDPSAGGNQPPRPSPVQRDPVTEPPPQNPGQPR